MKSHSTDEKLDVYLREQCDLIAVARSIVGNIHVAEDLVQDCWIRWNNRNYNPNQARPILIRIVKNLSLDWHRRRQSEFDALEAYRILQAPSHDTERIVSGRQQIDRVIRVLEGLPPRTLEAFRCSRLDGLTLKETGKRLGVSESRVSQLVSDALIRIITALEI